MLPDLDNIGHDRLAVAEITQASFDNITIRDFDDVNPIVNVGNKDEFDDSAVLDPASVIFKGKVFLYYSAIGSGPDSVGLAISDDGIHFNKHGFVMIGRAPEVIVKDDKVFLIYLQFSENGFKIYLASSKNGIDFKNVLDTPIFTPKQGSWDSLSITTARLFQDDDTFYMLYGGSSYLADEPDFIGLARSNNLIDWQSHPGNPIFGCGAKGEEDGGAIWFPALMEVDDAFILLYEGSRGKYSGDLSSQICMSTLPSKTTKRIKHC